MEKYLKAMPRPKKCHSAGGKAGETESTVWTCIILFLSEPWLTHLKNGVMDPFLTSTARRAPWSAW